MYPGVQENTPLPSARRKVLHLLLQPGHVRGICFSCCRICLVEHRQEGRDLVLVWKVVSIQSLFSSNNATHLVDSFLGWEGHLLHLLHLNLRRQVKATYKPENEIKVEPPR